LQLHNLISPFIEKLEAIGVPYMMTGSTAGIMYGEPRMTHDVDIVVKMARRDVAAFVSQFPDDEYYCPPVEVLEVEIRRGVRGHCNVISHATGFKADIYFAYDELHAWGLAHCRRVMLGELSVSVAPPEYVILRKLEYFREGGSHKHLRDIQSMLEVSAGSIDLAMIAQRCETLGLGDMWRQLLRDMAM